jgi:hypothetical protein
MEGIILGIRKMSIQEGLNELKTLDARIQRSLSERSAYGAIVIGNRTVRGYDSNEKFTAKAKSNFDSVKALIQRRTLIKNAIIKKNAEVVVNISGKEMTLAEAINTKAYIDADRQLLSQLTFQYNKLINEFESAEYQYQQKLDTHVENIVGKEQKDKMKANEEIINFFKEANEPKFIDPIDLKEVIETMSKDIEEFESKVDFVLTRANITNDIEFDDPSYEEVTE